MNRSFSSLGEIYAPGADTVIDVRSPAEYDEDHWPGALNLPVLSDAERARVGTIYKRQSPFQARVIGAAIVAENAAAHLRGALVDRPGSWRPLVYCWRGGQRSASFATILAQVGWRAGVVEGGYRTYRRLVAGYLHDRPLPHRLIVLDGNTGTAKTELLARIGQRGVQAVDLEALAAHRGSLFGATGRAQPAQKAFESSIAQAFFHLDAARPVVVEAESSRIGDLIVPPSLWAAMKAAPRVEIAAPVAARASYLVRGYADIAAEPARVDEVLCALVPYHGVKQVDRWRGLAASGALPDLAADLITCHYDPRYNRTRKSRRPAVATLHSDGLDAGDLDRLADRLAATVGKIAAG